MNSHPFDIIPVVNPNNDHVIGIVTTQGIMTLLSETQKS
jgi:predicted transcriptional regulator